MLLVCSATPLMKAARHVKISIIVFLVQVTRIILISLLIFAIDAITLFLIAVTAKIRPLARLAKINILFKKVSAHLVVFWRGVLFVLLKLALYVKKATFGQLESVQFALLNIQTVTCAMLINV